MSFWTICVSEMLQASMTFSISTGLSDVFEFESTASSHKLSLFCKAPMLPTTSCLCLRPDTSIAMYVLIAFAVNGSCSSQPQTFRVLMAYKTIKGRAFNAGSRSMHCPSEHYTYKTVATYIRNADDSREPSMQLECQWKQDFGDSEQADQRVVLHCLTFLRRSFAWLSVSKCFLTGSKIALRLRFKPSFKSPGCRDPWA